MLRPHILAYPQTGASHNCTASTEAGLKQGWDTPECLHLLTWTESPSLQQPTLKQGTSPLAVFPTCLACPPVAISRDAVTDPWLPGCEVAIQHP